ncbi:hypothetical protein GS500_18360 [Rhodococcus hoagii]|nr:hypothetical protein [Prescottella equi]
MSRASGSAGTVVDRFNCRVIVGDAINFPTGSRIRCTTPDRTLVFHVGLRSFAPSGPR